jgi:hypothetical protein
VSVPLSSAETAVEVPSASAPAPVPAPAPAPPAAPVTFPLAWLLDNASAPIQYRATVEVARIGEPGDTALADLPYSHRPALTLAVTQGLDGTWADRMFGTPHPIEPWPAGTGTIPAVLRLLEYGWDRESPPLLRARRLLFRLLAEDEDPSFLFELADEAGTDEDLIRRGRTILREAAAAVLAHAGYERDPRLRGAALRLLAPVTEYLRSPLAQKPWVRVGNRQVLSADAAPPSAYLLHMLAYMPLFCSEHAEQLDRIYDYVSQSLPRQEPFQIVGDHILEQPHLVLGDPLQTRVVVDADPPAAVIWLEQMARLGFLRRNEHWLKMLDRFLGDMDRGGVWRPHRRGDEAPATTNPFVWPFFPLDHSEEGEARWTDLTFRLGLVARLAGRPIELV